MVFVRYGPRAPTIVRRVSDDLLRSPATKSHAQSAIQSAAIGSVHRPAIWGVARLYIDDRDWWLWTRACSLWAAIRPIWRSAAHRGLWIQRRMGRATSVGPTAATSVGPTAATSAATSVGRPATAPAFATGRERGGTAIGASATSDPGSGTATARGNRIRCLRPRAAHAEPAGCQRSGAADPADRATDRRNAAGPAATTVRCHARRLWLGSIRDRQSSGEPRGARATIPVGVRRSGRLGATPAATD